MTVNDENRKIGINVSIPFKYISIIDKRAKEKGFFKRSTYIWNLIHKDLDERNKMQ